jgi:hypothetical protein
VRRGLCALMMTLVLPLAACGGGGGNEAEALALEVRSRYLEMTACAGHLELTADYGQRVYVYGVDLTWEKEGETCLTLTAPENVAGTVARIANGETVLEYDGVMVETGELDGAGLTPVDAVPALLTCAREGFLAECALEDWDGAQRLHVTSRDPEEEPGSGVETQLWFQPDTGALLRGEISSDGFTVVTCEAVNFTLTGPA